MGTYAHWGIYSEAVVAYFKVLLQRLPRKLREITKQAQPKLQVSGRDFNQEPFEYKSSAITMWDHAEKRYFISNKRLVTEQM
jgi:hypothetical protein